MDKLSLYNKAWSSFIYCMNIWSLQIRFRFMKIRWYYKYILLKITRKMGQNGNFSENENKTHNTQHTHARSSKSWQPTRTARQNNPLWDLFQDLRFERECMRPFGPSDFQFSWYKIKIFSWRKKRERKGCTQLFPVSSGLTLPRLPYLDCPHGGIQSEAEQRRT